MNTRFYNARILRLKDGHDFEIIKGEVWVKENRIVYVGEGDNADKTSDADGLKFDREIDVKDNLLMTGFKDAHTHTAMTFLRSYADDLPLNDWLYQQVFPREGQLTEEDVIPLNKLGIMEYLTSGITSNFDMYLFPPANAQSSVECGFRTVLTSGLNDFGGTPDLQRKFYKEVNSMSELTTFIVGFHAEYTTSMELMEGVSALAQELKSPVFLHNSETKAEVEGCIERYGKTPTALMEELGMFEYGGGGYHCVWMSEEDFDIFEKRNLTAVLNPASNLKLASGIAPTQTYLDRGINLALGTDGPASNNCLDMFREMFLMTALAKVRQMDAAVCPANEVLYAATAGGAHCMGLDDADDIKAGKLADLIILDLHQPNMQPENNIIKNIVYSGSKQNVILTMVNGKVLYEKGEFYIGADVEKIYAQANAIIGRMK